jgi:hypothetical protein
MPITNQYYFPTYSSILPRDRPLHLTPLTSCTHFLHVFDTFNFAVKQNNRTTQDQYVGFSSNGFVRDIKVHRTGHCNVKFKHVHQKFPYLFLSINPSTFSRLSHLYDKVSLASSTTSIKYTGLHNDNFFYIFSLHILLSLILSC